MTFRLSRLLAVYRRPLRTFPRAGFIHAHRNGSPVLIENSSWRTISGMFINVRHAHVIFQWRRWC